MSASIDEIHRAGAGAPATAAPDRAVVTGGPPSPATVPQQRTATGTATTGTGPVATGLACRCGHAADAHRHFRRGTDCSSCACGRYRRRGLRLALPRGPRRR